jgi:ribosomal protein S18 acetylase RimI-like enzyme
MVIIRRAEVADAAALARLQERTFRDAFEATNSAEDMALHCAAHYGDAIQRRELLDPNIDVLVCDDGGQLVGYAQIRRGFAPACVVAERAIEIQRFYVFKDWHGRRVAHDLMAAALVVCAKGGAVQVWLGVWEHNPRAIAFYAKWGFVEVGSHVFPLGTDPQRDIVMVRPVRGQQA